MKACDKGAGIFILNFEDYISACYEHLTSNQKEDEPYYTELSDLDLEISQKKINDILKEGLDSNIIDQSKFNAIKAEDNKAGRFYCNVNVHKQHEHEHEQDTRMIYTEKEERNITSESLILYTIVLTERFE